MTRYEHVAEQLRTRIQNGIYPVGSRLPGLRRLAKEFNVSISTVQSACQRLQDWGQLEARARSGFFIRPTIRPALPQPHMPPASKIPYPVTELAVATHLMTQTTQPGIQLGAAITDASFLARGLITRSITKANRDPVNLWLGYTVSPGNRNLRQAIAERLRLQGCAVCAEDVVITCGCHEAIVLALKTLTQPGDTVAIESPSFYGFLQAMQGLGLKVLEIPNHPTTGLSLEALEFALDRWPVKACVVTPNFSNPLGSLIPTSHKQALLKLLQARGVALIEDEIYGDLSHNTERPDNCLQYDASGATVIHCSSVSKSIAPGLRVGWAVSSRYAEALAKQKLLLNLAGPSLAQAMVAHIFQSGRYETHLRQLRPRLTQAVARMQQAVTRYFPETTRVSQPKGGFVLWLECPTALDSLELMRIAEAQKIYIAPGGIFSVSGKYTHCLRLNCAVPWDARVEAAIAFLGQTVSNLIHARPVVAGIEE